MSVHTHIVDIRGQSPHDLPMDDYLRATRNYFPLARWDCCLMVLDEIQARMNRLGVLLEMFGSDWKLAQHAAVLEGHLVAAVVQATGQGLLFEGECFPREEFHAHVQRVSEYLTTSAALNEQPNSPALHVRHEAAKRLAFPGDVGNRNERLAKSLTQARQCHVAIETGDGRKTKIELPERGKLVRDENKGESGGGRHPRLRISRIENVAIAYTTDGAIAILQPLRQETIDAAVYLEHGADTVPSRKAIWDGTNMRILTSDQMPLSF